MTTRVLPREEWPRLDGTELELVWPHLPDTARVVVVEDGTDVLGCWAFFPVIHAEGLWIAEPHRKRTGVARRLLRGMRETVRAMGGRVVSTAALTDDVRGLLTGFGAVQLPGTHHAMPIEGRGTCQQQ